MMELKGKVGDYDSPVEDNMEMMLEVWSRKKRLKTNDDLVRYINEMTYETNKMVGLNNLRLVWKVNHISSLESQSTKS